MASVDNLYAVVAVFFVAVSFFAIAIMWNAITDSDLATDLFDRTSVGSNAKAEGESIISNLGGLFLIIYFGIHIGILVLAFALPSRPIVYVVGLIILLILVMVAAPLSNAYETLANNPDSLIVQAKADVGLMHDVMLNLPVWEIIFGFIVLLIIAGMGRE